MQALAERINERTDRINQVSEFDLAGDVLAELRVHRTVLTHLNLGAFEIIGHRRSDAPLIYLLQAGVCVVRVGEEDPIILRANDVLAIPGGERHQLSALGAKGTFMRGRENLPALLQARVQFDGAKHHPLWQSLPRVLHLPASNDAASPVPALIRLIEGELTSIAGEASVTADRLVDILFHLLLKHHIAEGGAVGGLFQALRDPRLVRALSLMHRHLAGEWTLDRLAQQAGASRATLARRFKQTLGLAPMDYLTLQRLERSRDLLRDSHYSLDRVAQEVGYGSSQSYARAFRRRFGHSPGELRRTATV
ncbi:MAG: helix-turn-helix domain-containing protein [Pseudomonadota bacterium]